MGPAQSPASDRDVLTVRSAEALMSSSVAQPTLPVLADDGSCGGTADLTVSDTTLEQRSILDEGACCEAEELSDDPERCDELSPDPSWEGDHNDMWFVYWDSDPALLCSQRHRNAGADCTPRDPENEDESARLADALAYLEANCKAVYDFATDGPIKLWDERLEGGFGSALLGANDPVGAWPDGQTIYLWTGEGGSAEEQAAIDWRRTIAHEAGHLMGLSSPDSAVILCGLTPN